jgi:phosphoribosylformylglycinamidine cyclo-ligase
VDVRAMSHITGGGLPGNLPRVLPDGLGVRVTGAWRRPAIFDLIAARGPVAEPELRRTFNCGVGYVFIVSRESEAAAWRALEGLGEAPIRLGEVVAVEADREFEARLEWALP